MKPLSAVDLDDPESVRFDDSGRSPAYFCKKLPVKIDKKLVEQLRKKSRELGDKSLRLCLHDSGDALLHEMVILALAKNYYRPHKHIRKGESYHLIEGSLGIIVFDDDGEMLETCVLRAGETFLYRIGVGRFHATVPLTDVVVYHEATPGPFTGQPDSIFPEWAPDGKDEKAAQAFKAKMIRDAGFKS